MIGYYILTNDIVWKWRETHHLSICGISTLHCAQQCLENCILVHVSMVELAESNFLLENDITTCLFHFERYAYFTLGWGKQCPG